MIRTQVVKKTKHILCSYFFFENGTVCDVIWKNIVEPDNPHDLMRMRIHTQSEGVVKASCNVIAHAQKPDFVFRRNGRVHLNRQGRPFIRLLAAEVCASAVVMVAMLDTPCSEVV